MENTIRHQYYFEYPPETVWEFLTDPDLLAQWLMENTFKPVVGQKFQFRAKPKVNIGFDGNIYCEVLELVPCQKLSYSWRGGPGNGKITLDSVVTWTLRKKDGGTELILEHTGFKGFRNYISYLVMNKGWVVILKKRLSQKLTNQYNETTNG